MNHLIKKSLLLILISLSSKAFTQTITIDLSKEYQTIRGFGGMNHTTWIKDLNADNREKAFGNDPGEIGLSILRMHLDPNSAKFALEVPTALHAMQKGASVFATPWNAPDALLDLNATPIRVDPNKYDEYVSHLNLFNTYMSNNGVPLYAISVQNEPDFGEWTRWTSAEMLDFMKNYAQNINNRVMAPESFQFRRAFTDPILNDTQALANLEIVGGHIYGGGLFDYPLARNKGKEVWMTEHLLGSGDGHINNWELALSIGKEINDCMVANFNAYVWWYIRRSYGLITDNGNITDKGYVISQFSKFIRPDAVRIDASVSSAPNVDVTAYKTDTSLVMVVINRNSTNTTLNFSIHNGTFAQYTQFTTSETKKLVNDGELTVSSNSFIATIDSKSVTTFTSYAGFGGKYGNTAPTAIAGDDVNIADTLGAGSTIITLNGATSKDTDGEITNYSWSLDGQQIAWEATTQVSITLGEYDLILTVTDNDGTTDSDSIHVSLTTTKSTEIWLEAECGTIGSNWEKPSDATASDGMYVESKNDVESTASASTSPENLLVYNFTTIESGNFKVWGRVITPSANDDSYWIQVDESDWTMWNSIPIGSDWHWDDVHDQANNKTVFYQLEPGNHIIRICMREDGSKLDKILIANTGITPSEEGVQATDCSLNSIALIHGNVPNFKIYPNPSTGTINIECADGFNSLNILNSMRQSVYSKQYSQSIKSTNEFVNAKPGIYFVILSNANNLAVSKLIIKK